MSTEKRRAEALRWFQTSESDLDAARILQQGGKFAHACFHAQQAGEKAVKALWHLVDADPWGHSIKKLIQDLETVDNTVHLRLAPLIQDGAVLDRFYIPTRYPNGLPDITPEAAFFAEDAESAIRKAGRLLETVRPLLS